MTWLKALAIGTTVFSAMLAVHGESAPTTKPVAPKVDLGGPDRFSTAVSTDKPIYKPGETLYARAVVLNAFSRKPLAESSQAQVEITGPKGDVLANSMAQLLDGAIGFSWPIPEGTAGGQYTLKVSHPWLGHAPASRTFDIRAYRAPRLKSQIVFLRDGYGPGDTASASLKVERAEGGIPAGAKVTAIARVDGDEVARIPAQVDAKGNCSASFKLPAQIARGEGTLAFVIEDGGVLETATKTIPILLQTLDLSMYPEGGELVAGLEGRVYLEAFTPARKPADLKAVIVDSKGKEVAQARTEHEGRGRFVFTPAAGERYVLKVVEPSGIKTAWPLPEVRESGVALRATKDVYAKGEPITLQVMGQGEVKVTLARIDREVAALAVTLSKDAPATGLKPVDVVLTPPGDVDGVLIATVWDHAGKPLAERLVFRQPAKTVNVKIAPDKSSYVPGEQAKLTVTTTDEAGKPVAAVVGLTVSDDSVQEMIEKREQAPRLPAMVLLENDVKELADAHIYLDASNPKASLATDLLLGTQGWRKFATVNVLDFVEKNGDAARKALAMRVVTRMEVEAAAMAMDDGMVGGAGAVRRGARFEARPMAAMPAKGMANGQDQQKAEDKAQAVREPIQMQKHAGPMAQPGPAVVAGKQMAAQKPLELKQDELAERLDANAEKDMKKRIVAGDRDALRRRQIAPVVTVREYAHALRPERRPTDRIDFAETLYWSAATKTDDKTGTATVAFVTSDAVTSFRVSADAYTGDGAIAAAAASISSVQPFYVEPKLPLQVTSGDVIQLPLAFVNGTSGDLANASIHLDSAPGLKLTQVDAFTLKANARDRRIAAVNVGDFVGTSDFVLVASAGEYKDRAVRKLSVSPMGFPIDYNKGGLLSAEAGFKAEIEIPANRVNNSLTSEIAIYPTPLANMTGALEALIREPSGCFEQTSSTTYPLIMAQQYFLTHQGVDAKLIERSRQLLDNGYNRLIGFESKSTKGFEWFGADPGHEALSAYGLLEFSDMQKVREVDQRMLNDCRAYLLKIRDGKGGFKREQRTLHTWINDPECSNGYILWALLENNEKGMEKEVAWLKEASAKSPNTYAVALAANVMFLAGDKEASKALMDKLAAKQNKDGFIDGATTSIVGSGGDALNIETTSLAVLAWLRDPSYAPNVEKSMKWLAEACKAGRFGSTQSTVLALKAIVAYDKSRAHPKNAGTIYLSVDGKPAGDAVAFGTDASGPIQLQNIAEWLTPGKHTVELKMEGGSPMPFAFSVKYNTPQPNSSEQCKVSITTSLKDAEMAEGNVTEANVVVSNKSKEAIPTPIAIVGIPGGLEVRHDQLKELVKAGRIDAYEVIGRDVVLYWREMAPEKKVELPLSLVAAVPGTYTGPASRAYLYYTDEHKQWSPGLVVKISAKAQ